MTISTPASCEHVTFLNMYTSCKGPINVDMKLGLPRSGPNHPDRNLDRTVPDSVHFRSTFELYRDSSVSVQLVDRTEKLDRTEVDRHIFGGPRRKCWTEVSVLAIPIRSTVRYWCLEA